MKIAMLQVTVEASRDPLQVLTKAVTECGHSGVNLLLTPELYMCGYCDMIALKSDPSRQDGIETSDRVAALKQLAKDHNVSIVTGIAEVANVEKETTAADDDSVGTVTQSTCLYNTTLFVDNLGNIAAKYRKTHLYGMFENHTFLPSRNEPPILQNFCGFNVGLLCCFDVEFPEMARCLRLRGANFIIAPSAACDPMVHRYMITTRAYENMCFMAYPNYIGDSVLGCVPSSSSSFGEEVLKKCRFVGGASIVGPDGSDCLRMPSFTSPVCGLSEEDSCIQLQVPRVQKTWPEYDGISDDAKNTKIYKRRLPVHPQNIEFTQVLPLGHPATTNKAFLDAASNLQHGHCLDDDKVDSLVLRIVDIGVSPSCNGDDEDAKLVRGRNFEEATAHIKQQLEMNSFLEHRRPQMYGVISAAK